RLYGEIVQDERAKDITFLYYGETLMSNEKYDEAREWFHKYSERKPDDERGRLMAISCSEVKNIQPMFTNVNIKGFTQNSETDDTAPVAFNEGVVFSSDRPQGMKLLKQKSGTTGRDFIKLYYSAQNIDGTFEPAKPYSGKINELNKNTGPITFSADGSLAVFSRNSKVANKKDIYPMQLYSAESADGNKWKNIKEMEFCRLSYNYMHPALSPDGKWLFFVSDKGQGVGGTDLYVSKLTDKGWGKAKNLGATINTSMNEGFPFMDHSGKLYFSSKGHPGYGGFDIFYTERDENGNWQKPVNVGRPINSPLDDISIYVQPGGERGMFTSSREGGDDDIFFFFPKSNDFEEEESEMLVFEEQPIIPSDAVEEVTELPDDTNPPIPSNDDPISDSSIPTNTSPSQDVASAPAYNIPDASPATSVEEDVSPPANEEVAVPAEEEETYVEFEPEDNPPVEKAPTYTAPTTPETVVEQASANDPIPEQEDVVETPAAAVETIDNSTTIVETETVEMPSGPLPEDEEVINPEPMEEQPSIETMSPQSAEPEAVTNETTYVEPETAIDPPTSLPPSLHASDPITAPATKEDAYESKGIVESSGDIPEPTFIENPTPAYESLPSNESLTIYTYDDLSQALSSSRVGPGQTFQLPNIKYSFNEFTYEPTPEIQAQLNQLLSILQSHPSLRIEIGGYTSSFGEDTVNKTLSRYRAEAAVAYLVDNGISKDRLTARGYGETKLLNECQNGVLCTRAQHMENQRLEIKILVF
ncbi:MAG: OmpA family protein, partial [Bacteroidota bacterium]